MARAFFVGDWLIEPDFNRISRNNKTTLLQPRLMALLVCLTKRAGELITKDQLVSAVWIGVVVTDNAVTRAISQLRLALGDDPRDPRYIATVPTKGYYLVATVRLTETADSTHQTPVHEALIGSGARSEAEGSPPLLAPTSMSGWSQIWAWLRRTTGAPSYRTVRPTPQTGTVRSLTPGE